MNILIAGASGMLGKTLIQRLSKDHETTAVSRSGPVRCDLSVSEEVERLFESRGFDLVIHAAAYSDVDGCERDAARAFAANALSARHVGGSCGRRGVPWVYISTDYVFDGSRQNGGYETEDPAAPINIYGMTKLAGEFYARTSESDSAIVRTSWLFGPGNPNNFVNQVIERLRREPLVRVLDDQTDSPTSIRDLAACIEKIGNYLVSRNKNGGPEHLTFHVCNNGAATRYDMTLKIQDWIGSKARVEKLDAHEIPDRVAIRPAYAVMSTRRYRDFFGEPLRPWETALEEYVRECAY